MPFSAILTLYCSFVDEGLFEANRLSCSAARGQRRRHKHPANLRRCSYLQKPEEMKRQVVKSSVLKAATKSHNEQENEIFQTQKAASECRKVLPLDKTLFKVSPTKKVQEMKEFKSCKANVLQLAG